MGTAQANYPGSMVRKDAEATAAAIGGEQEAALEYADRKLHSSAGNETKRDDGDTRGARYEQSAPKEAFKADLNEQTAQESDRAPGRDSGPTPDMVVRPSKSIEPVDLQVADWGHPATTHTATGTLGRHPWATEQPYSVEDPEARYYYGGHAACNSKATAGEQPGNWGHPTPEGAATRILGHAAGERATANYPTHYYGGGAGMATLHAGGGHYGYAVHAGVQFNDFKDGRHAHYHACLVAASIRGDIGSQRTCTGRRLLREWDLTADGQGSEDGTAPGHSDSRARSSNSKQQRQHCEQSGVESTSGDNIPNAS